MSNINVSGGITINLLQNGDNLNTALNATSPLYQTFKKGTQDFSPNWATMSDLNRPVIYPRVYSVMENRAIIPTDITWRYNNVAMSFDSSGVATAPDIAAGKVKQIDYNGAKALRMIGNVASDVNNDSDVITFQGNVMSSGQTIPVSADITLLIEEGSNNLFRLFLTMADDVIDGDEENLTMMATLYNNGAIMTSGAQYEFTDQAGIVLKPKSSSNTFTITRAMIDSELLVVGKAYVNNEVVAQEHKQVWDAKDPYTIICDQGTSNRQRAIDDTLYTFSLLNARTSNVVPSVVFTIKVYKNSNTSDITSQFAITSSTVMITGAKIAEHKSLYVDASATIDA